MLGTRHAKKPLELKIPITIAGMSFGALSAPAKEALGRGATRGRHVDDHRRRRHDARGARALDDARLPAAAVALRHEPRRPAPADAIEIVIGQGAKPGGGGMLLGQKISDRVAEMRDLPEGIDQRSACRHPDWTGPGRPRDQDRASCARSPTGRSRSSSRSAPRAPYYDVQLAVKAGADVVVRRRHAGRHRGDAGRLHRARRHPDAARRSGRRSTRCRSSACTARCSSSSRAASAPAPTWPRRSRWAPTRCSIGVAALIALGDNAPELDEEYAQIGTRAPASTTTGTRAATRPGISTQDAELAARFDPELGGRRLANYLRTLTLETQTLARACGKSHVHNLEPEDLVALTVEAAAMARVPLAGTSWIPGPTAELLATFVPICLGSGHACPSC